MVNVVFIPATRETEWVDELLPGTSPAELPVAGRRVIENTIHQKLPDDFQSAEYLEKHGFIDKIVERSELKGFLAKMLNYWGF
jgi:acetyl-CoA carboxylase beta subunit